MPDETGAPNTRTEAVAVVDDAERMQAAIDDLLNHGFDQADISMLASEEAIEQKLGHLYTRVQDLEESEDVPRKEYVSTAARGDAQGGLIGGLMYVGALAAVGGVFASGGTLGVALASAAAAAGAGGAAGAALAKVIGDRHAKELQRQLDRGGLLLWVRTREPELETRAKEILRQHSGKDVHLHELPDPQAT
jgi:outer membrane lipoprotein SlyB